MRLTVRAAVRGSAAAALTGPAAFLVAGALDVAGALSRWLWGWLRGSLRRAADRRRP